MGISNFPSVAEAGMLPVLVMNMVWSLLQVMRVGVNLPDLEEDPDVHARERRVSVTQFKSLCHNRSNRGGASTSTSGCVTMECCVCLCGFEADEDVSELSCKHFFHKGCLEKWFGNKHSTCPLCRSIY